MTACVNRKHTKKVAAVVTASLVGALSLGVAPVAAVADTGIETLAANWATGAKVTAATDGKGATVTGDLERKSFTAKSGKFLVPTEITGTYTTTEVNEDYLRYEKRNTSGGYSLVGATGSLDDAIAYFATGSTGTDTTGTYRVTYTYDGESYDVHFKISGEGKVEGVTVKGTPTYNGKDQSSTLSFVDAEGYEIANGATSSISYKDAKGDGAVPQNAGDYIAEFSDGTNTYSVPFSIAKLDLSTSTVVVKDTDTAIISEADLEDNLYINGSVAGGATGTLAGEIEVTKVTNPAGTAGFGSGNAGVYQVTIAPVANNKNITGTASISYCIVDDMVADAVEYNRVDYTGSTLKIELAYGDVFDASKIVVKDTAGNSYTGDDLEITYTDTDDNKTVDASALANVGEYELTIRVKPTQDFATGAWSGGTITLDVEVVAVGLDDSEDLAFFVDGELAGNTESVTYDGTDQLDKISVVVKGADGTDLVEGTDYEIKVTNTDTNREVDSIVDAGEYEIKVNPLTFSFGSSPNDTLTLTVNPIKIGLAVTDGDLKDFLYRTNTAGTVVLQNDAVAYTGSAVEIPTVKYPVLNEDGTDVKRDKDETLSTLICLPTSTTSSPSRMRTPRRSRRPSRRASTPSRSPCPTLPRAITSSTMTSSSSRSVRPATSPTSTPPSGIRLRSRRPTASGTSTASPARTCLPPRPTSPAPTPCASSTTWPAATPSETRTSPSTSITATTPASTTWTATPTSPRPSPGPAPSA